jgi:hypothetical protein
MTQAGTRAKLELRHRPTDVAGFRPLARWAIGPGARADRACGRQRAVPALVMAQNRRSSAVAVMRLRQECCLGAHRA